MELSDYLPIVIYCAAGLAVAGAIFALSKIMPSRPNAAKGLPYESGILPAAPVRQRFSIDFYLTAMLFIIFDIELAFLYPIAVTVSALTTLSTPWLIRAAGPAAGQGAAIRPGLGVPDTVSGRHQ